MKKYERPKLTVEIDVIVDLLTKSGEKDPFDIGNWDEV